ncbi:MAG: FkbM family methyltransferase [Sedimentisphaerales bacterium]|nr:FkbM family methyltransferase [Sedimentisphaerales bacterium]
MPKISLWHHPILYYRRKWLKHRCKHFQAPKGKQIKTVNGIKMVFDLDLPPMVKMMYFGSYELEIVQLLKQYLRPGGTFLDIGANVGYFSGLALGLVGTAGQVHAFEPMPQYHKYIAEMAQLNPDHKLIANNIALGNENGSTTIYEQQHNIGGSSLVQGYFPDEQTKATHTVPLQRLDDYLDEHQINKVSLIKMDVQGFEFPVLQGAQRFLEQHRDQLPPIVVEYSPYALDLVHATVDDFQAWIDQLGYQTYCICNTHKINLADIKRENQDIILRPPNKH